VNVSLLLTLSPIVMVLLKWTALLAFGWTMHWLLRHKHARWRLVLWRSILCFGLVLPVVGFVSIPVFQIPIQGELVPNSELSDVVPRVAIGKPIQPVQSSQKPPEVSATLQSIRTSRSKTSPESFSVKTFF